MQTAFVNAGAFANGVLRRKFGMNPNWREASTVEKGIKAVAGFAMRGLGVSKPFQRTDLVRFKLDSTARGFVRPVANPYQRVH